MSSIKDKATIEIRIFGMLRKYMDSQGLPYFLKKVIESKSYTPFHIANSLHIPIKEIEAVFVNGKILDIHTPLSDGDRIALLPYGTPGPYRVFLGMIKENPKPAKNIHPKDRDNSGDFNRK